MERGNGEGSKGFYLLDKNFFSCAHSRTMLSVMSHTKF
jgi:hypothetical protein